MTEVCPNCGRTRNAPIGPDLTKCLSCGQTWVSGTQRTTSPVLPTASKALAAEAWLMGVEFSRAEDDEGRLAYSHDAIMAAFEAWWATRE